MKQEHNVKSQPNQGSLGKRMLTGAGIGLLLISLYLLTTDKPDPTWSRLWMVRPLIIVPLAGAMGGLCHYFLLQFHHLAGLNRTLALILSVIIFVIGLWMGIVVGLDGTMWN